jgi:hypothetical protein
MTQTFFLVDTSEVVTWPHDGEPSQRFHAVERMTSMACGDEDPETVYYANESAATTLAHEWTMSEPWRRHAQVRTYAPGFTSGLACWVRGWPDGALTCDKRHLPTPRSA